MTIEQKMTIRLEEMAKERDAAIEDAKDWEGLAYRHQGERDALAAHLHANTMLMQRLFLCDDYSNNGEGEGTSDGVLVPIDLVTELAELSATTPNASLTRLKAEWQVEVLEDASSKLVQDWDESVAARRVQSIADEIRRQYEKNQ